MILNRWTILAAILVLSTVIGLAFRPWGEGPSSPQIVEDEHLSLTCPESFTAYSGRNFIVECQALAVTALGNRDRVSASVRVRPLGPVAQKGWSFDEVSPDVYDLWVRVRAARDGIVELEVRKRVPAEVNTDFVAEPFIPLAREPISSLPLNVLIRVQHHFLFYTGFGLSVVLLMALLSIPIASWMYRRLRGNHRITPHSADQMDYLIVRILWPSYYALLTLMLLFHIVDTFAVDSIQRSFPQQLAFVVTIPLFLLLFAILWFVQRRTLRNADPLGSSQRDQSDIEGRQPSLVPFVRTLATGFVIAPLALLFNWAAYLL